MGKRPKVCGELIQMSGGRVDVCGLEWRHAERLEDPKPQHLGRYRGATWTTTLDSDGKRRKRVDSFGGSIPEERGAQGIRMDDPRVPKLAPHVDPPHGGLTP